MLLDRIEAEAAIPLEAKKDEDEEDEDEKDAFDMYNPFGGSYKWG